MMAFILFILATAGVKGFAFIARHRHAHVAVHRRPATQAVLGTMAALAADLAPDRARAPASARAAWTSDFMGASKWFFSVSGVILLIGALAIGGKGLNFGIDFESGTRDQGAFVQAADEERASVTLGRTAGFRTPRSRRSGRQGARRQRLPDLDCDAARRRRSTGVTSSSCDAEFGERREPNSAVDRPDVRQDGGQDARSSRSSRRCSSSAPTSRCGSSGSSPSRC